MPRFAAAAALAMAAPAAAAAPAIAAPAAAAPAGPGPFACDAVDGPWAAFVARPDAGGVASLTLLDRRTGGTATRAVAFGPADHGAGNVWWPLRQGARGAGAIHGINPGMVDGAGADALPPVKDVRLGRLSLRCRWLPGLRLLGIGRARSVAVTREAGGWVYRSVDLARRGGAIEGAGGVTTNRPTLTIAGGVATGPGAWRFATRGYTYRVTAAGVTVAHAGRRIGTTPFALAAAR